MTRFCDHNVLAPFSLGILGFIAMIVIFVYFATFTALSFATPGMLWTHCEVRNLQGEHPTVNESLWRAFGVLVSISALMVGFVWAYVDSRAPSPMARSDVGDRNHRYEGGSSCGSEGKELI